MLSDGRAALVPYGQVGTPGRLADYRSIAIEGHDRKPARQVHAGYDDGFATLADFFANLLENWRGWIAAQEDRSIEGDFRIVATHDGQVNLELLLWESTEPMGWRRDRPPALRTRAALARSGRRRGPGVSSPRRPMTGPRPSVEA